MTIGPDLTMLGGTPVTAADQQPRRREETLRILGQEHWGVMPLPTVHGDILSAGDACRAGYHLHSMSSMDRHAG